MTTRWAGWPGGWGTRWAERQEKRRGGVGFPEREFTGTWHFPSSKQLWESCFRGGKWWGIMSLVEMETELWGFWGEMSGPAWDTEVRGEVGTRDGWKGKFVLQQWQVVAGEASLSCLVCWGLLNNAGGESNLCLYGWNFLFNSFNRCNGIIKPLTLAPNDQAHTDVILQTWWDLLLLF